MKECFFFLLNFSSIFIAVLQLKLFFSGFDTTRFHFFFTSRFFFYRFSCFLVLSHYNVISVITVYSVYNSSNITKMVFKIMNN